MVRSQAGIYVYRERVQAQGISWRMEALSNWREVIDEASVLVSGMSIPAFALLLSASSCRSLVLSRQFIRNGNLGKGLKGSERLISPIPSLVYNHSSAI